MVRGERRFPRATTGSSPQRGHLYDLDRAEPHCHQAGLLPAADNGSPWGASFVLAFSGLSFPVIAKEWRQAADLRIDLSPLSVEETATFVHSLADALHLPKDIFDAGAVQVVCDVTHGVPQAIVRLCQMSLLSATHDQTVRISSDVVEAAWGGAQLFSPPGLILLTVRGP